MKPHANHIEKSLENLLKMANAAGFKAQDLREVSPANWRLNGTGKDPLIKGLCEQIARRLEQQNANSAQS